MASWKNSRYSSSSYIGPSSTYSYVSRYRDTPWSSYYTSAPRNNWYEAYRPTVRQRPRFPSEYTPTSSRRSSAAAISPSQSISKRGTINRQRKTIKFVDPKRKDSIPLDLTRIRRLSDAITDSQNDETGGKEADREVAPTQTSDVSGLIPSSNTSCSTEVLVAVSKICDKKFELETKKFPQHSADAAHDDSMPSQTLRTVEISRDEKANGGKVAVENQRTQGNNETKKETKPQSTTNKRTSEVGPGVDKKKGHAPLPRLIAETASAAEIVGAMPSGSNKAANDSSGKGSKSDIGMKATVTLQGSPQPVEEAKCSAQEHSTSRAAPESDVESLAGGTTRVNKNQGKKVLNETKPDPAFDTGLKHKKNKAAKVISQNDTTAASLEPGHIGNRPRPPGDQQVRSGCEGIGSSGGKLGPEEHAVLDRRESQVGAGPIPIEMPAQMGTRAPEQGIVEDRSRELVERRGGAKSSESRERGRLADNDERHKSDPPKELLRPETAAKSIGSGDGDSRPANEIESVQVHDGVRAISKAADLLLQTEEPGAPPSRVHENVTGTAKKLTAAGKLETEHDQVPGDLDKVSVKPRGAVGKAKKIDVKTPHAAADLNECRKFEAYGKPSEAKDLTKPRRQPGGRAELSETSTGRSGSSAQMKPAARLSEEAMSPPELPQSDPSAQKPLITPVRSKKQYKNLENAPGNGEGSSENPREAVVPLKPRGSGEAIHDARKKPENENDPHRGEEERTDPSVRKSMLRGTRGRPKSEERNIVEKCEAPLAASTGEGKTRFKGDPGKPEEQSQNPEKSVKIPRNQAAGEKTKIGVKEDELEETRQLPGRTERIPETGATGNKREIGGKSGKPGYVSGGVEKSPKMAGSSAAETKKKTGEHIKKSEGAIIKASEKQESTPNSREFVKDGVGNSERDRESLADSQQTEKNAERSDAEVPSRMAAVPLSSDLKSATASSVASAGGNEQIEHPNEVQNAGGRTNPTKKKGKKAKDNIEAKPVSDGRLESSQISATKESPVPASGEPRKTDDASAHSESVGADPDSAPVSRKNLEGVVAQKQHCEPKEVHAKNGEQIIQGGSSMLVGASGKDSGTPGFQADVIETIPVPVDIIAQASLGATNDGKTALPVEQEANENRWTSGIVRNEIVHSASIDCLLPVHDDDATLSGTKGKSPPEIPKKPSMTPEIRANIQDRDKQPVGCDARNIPLSQNGSRKTHSEVESFDDDEDAKSLKDSLCDRVKAVKPPKAIPVPDLQASHLGTLPKDQQMALESRLPRAHASDKAVVERRATDEILRPRTVDQPVVIRFRKYSLLDFHLLKVLGKGSFGKVFLVELRDVPIYFAMKCLKKDVVLEDDDVECTLVERQVLSLGSHNPFICKLFCTFQTESHLFFVMEFLRGGDLMFHVQNEGSFTEDRARFYGAEIVCALKFLHRRGIVYRDLKLDNVCLDGEGHIRLIDFGMCVPRVYRYEPTAFCGTPEYMAPEVIEGKHYNYAVDWWSFGVVMYEMLRGRSPYTGCDEDELFWNVMNTEVEYPKYFTREAKDLIKNLLQKEPERRLGVPESGQGDIKDHGFFYGISWSHVEKKQLTPQFRPFNHGANDVSNFDEDFTREPAVLTPVAEDVLATMDQELFKEFSYTNPNMTT
ncbi:uncharacterized protein LOC100899606 [Galendromus occidentalis]|uniref:Uncharacterized protein LOC100899606 n=1 Tax=Galendromus occidentalis TaxID=34638 RepID=A0AAJ7L3H3_9ACAR|nr:uncharacterized protein LOC100899606 [Galendromus occidentalis]